MRNRQSGRAVRPSVGLQNRKTRDAAFVLDHDFAVEQRGLGGQLRDAAAILGNFAAQSRPLPVRSRTSP